MLYTSHCKTLLIANRGEIAGRVIRACRKLGIRAVAVYSDADTRSAHVAEADIAVGIGPAPAADSYLNIPAILDAARRVEADAIHPGYGFLAENADFARACAAAGLTFIGPPAEAIAAMGDKRAARALAERAGVPVLPGFDGGDQSDAAFRAAAGRLGYPLMVKPAAGGGGKGMRLVGRADELPEALAVARREAAAAFGSAGLLLERALLRPRHIEIQVLGDRHGSVIHLGERECSVQRRHQKVIEECPSPAMTPELRAAMGAAATTLAGAIGYTGAGTVEFLVEDGRFYFLEMNTRLQVEHPVTELVTGIDLVEWQIRVAEGAALPWRQTDVIPRGHAIEARLYAEDPTEAFRPATGTVLCWRPPAGEGIRVDDGIRDGDEVPVHYDPLLAKIIAHGETRTDATRRLRQALERSALLGLANNRRFLIGVLGHEAFAAGELSTHFLEDHPIDLAPPDDERDVALIAAALARFRRDAGSGPGHWRNNPGAPALYRFRLDGQEVVVELTPLPRTAGTFVVRLPGREQAHTVTLDAHDPPDLALTRDGIRHKVVLAVERDTWWAQTATTAIRLAALPLLPEPRRAADAAGSLRAPVPGRVAAVLVAPGQSVVEGQPLVKLEAMKMEYTIRAAAAGIVEAVHYAVGEQVGEGELLAQITDR